MLSEILLTGVSSLALWGFVWHRHAAGPLRWASPTGLFAAGILLLYVIPSVYWQFRPWDYYVPPYFEGLPLVLLGAGVLGLPFLACELLGRGARKPAPLKLSARPGDFGGFLWAFLPPLVFGMGWRAYLLTQGWQSRLAGADIAFLGSEELGLIILNFHYYYPVCYFALAAFGTRGQRLTGLAFWGLDGLMMVCTLHRYEIILFFLRSAVFGTILGWKLKMRQWVLLGVSLALVLTVMGKTPDLVYLNVTSSRQFLDPAQVAEVLLEASKGLLQEDYGNERESSLASNPVWRILDDAMYRLYDARSASAVMESVPTVIPYSRGETFRHILYAYVPRYFWPDKPDLEELHHITTWVMTDDLGLAPREPLPNSI